jgi:hypothetical protein
MALLAGVLGIITASTAASRRARPLTAFPHPGSPAVAAETDIGFRGRATVGDVVVAGSHSGVHRGHFVEHSDGRGTTFVPDTPFVAGERVDVQTSTKVRDATAGDFSFTVARPAAPANAVALAEIDPDDVAALGERAYVTRPDLHVPDIDVVTNTDDASHDDGPFFLTPAGGAQAGTMIVTGGGEPVWFAPNPSATDLQVQQLHGEPVLTWFEGTSHGSYGEGTFVVADEQYHRIARVRAANGYAADLHDFVLTPQGTALLIAYVPVVGDTTSVGGAPDRPIIDAVVQEIDLDTGEAVFEWHALGSVPLSDSYQPLPDDPAVPYDYVHVNAVAFDTGGNLLVSARHTSTIYAIDRTTGRVEWRLGGKRSSFTMGTGTAFSWQHDARWQDDGTLTVFDNGASNIEQDEAVSRALVLDVDEGSRTARLRRAYEGNVLSKSQGNAQRLPDGDTVVGWGDQPVYSQFDRDGTLEYEARLPAVRTASVHSYRAFRYPWSAQPTTLPDVVARTDGETTDVYVSWNGATDVARWEVRDGDRVLAKAPSRGFETHLAVKSLPPVVEVRAINDVGEVLATVRRVVTRHAASAPS